MLDFRLIILSAPAGYGKTSLLIDFAHNTEWPFCWYALDTLDREPQRFLAHFISSIQMQFPSFGIRSRTILSNMAQGELNLDSMVSVIVNDAYENITEHFFLVLDDYHNVDNSQPVSYFLSRLIQDIDDNCHVIISSRSLISLPDLPLMVARSQVGGLSFEELAFNAQEIQALMQQNYHKSISENMARDLARNSEGWITGLLLSSLTAEVGMVDRLRLGKVSNVGLYDFLAEQVFEHQPAEIQTFLLRSALIEEFDADLCQDVIGESLEIEADWSGLVNAVFHKNLFVLPVGEEEIWLRYHNLFRDFLQNKMLRERPEETQKILSRMAEIFNRNGEWERIYQLYQRLGKTDQIVDLLERIGGDMISSGRLITLGEWLDSLPQQIIHSNPILLSLQGSVLVIRGEQRRGLEQLNRAVEGLRTERKPELLARTLVRRSTACRNLGDYRQAMDDVDEAMSLTGDRVDLGPIYAEALHRKGMVHYLMGELKEALEYLSKSLQEYLGQKDEKNCAFLWMEIGLVQTAIGNYLAAEDAYTRSLEFWEQTKNTTWLANVLNNLGDLQRLMGAFESAITTLERAIEYSRMSGYLRMEAYSLASIGDLYRDLEAVEQALEAYNRARVITNRIQDRFLSIYLDLGEAALCSRRGKLFQARALLENATRVASSGHSAFEQNLCRLEQGRFQVKNNAYQDALENLQTASRYFIDEGHSVEAMRAQLFLLIARYETVLDADVREDWAHFFSRMTGQDNRPAMLTLLGEVRPFLEKIHSNPDFAPIIDYALQELDQFEQTLLIVRRKLRRRANVVPFAPPKMYIQALGKIQVRINDHYVSSSDWQTQTARDLFYFLLARQEGITKEAVGEVFWLDSSPTELKMRFKNTIYRLRHAVGKDAIVFRDDIYQFNTMLDYEYDVELFFKEIYHAERSEDRQAKVNFFQASLKYYQGPYLPGVEESWVLVERQKIYDVYISVLNKLGMLYLENNEYQEALVCSQKILAEDPCLEDGHRLAMRTYHAMGNLAAITRQYEYCQQILSEELHTAPSPNTRNLYETLIR